MKIYILTSGIYSDYNIVGVYSIKEKAEQARDFYGEDKHLEIGEWEVDGNYVHPVYFFMARFSKDREIGEIVRYNQKSLTERIEKTYNPEGFFMEFYCHTKDLDQVKKIAIDKFYLKTHTYRILPNGQVVCPVCGTCASGYPNGTWREVSHGDGTGYFAPVCPKCNFVFEKPYFEKPYVGTETNGS